MTRRVDRGPLSWLLAVASLAAACTSGGSPPSEVRLSAPRGVSAEAGPGGIQVLTWEPVQLAEYYEVEAGPVRSVVPSGACDHKRCRVVVDHDLGEGRRVRVSAISKSRSSAQSPPVTLRDPTGPGRPPLYDVYALVATREGRLVAERHPAAGDVEAARVLGDLARRPEVILARRDHYGRVLKSHHNEPPSDPDWYKAALGVEQMPTEGDGRGRVVAVVDAGGVDAEHPGLKGAVLAGTTIPEPDTPGTAYPSAHATAVAGLVVGHGNRGLDRGVAPGAQVLPVDVKGRDDHFTISSVITGILWAVDNGAHIVTVSVGFSCDDGSDDDCKLSESGLLDAVDYAAERNVVVVLAAGNNGGGARYCERPTNQRHWPAGHPRALTVGGSTLGGKRWACTPDDTNIDVLAPATNLALLAPSRSGALFATGAGTSYAAPLVAGVAARAWSLAPHLPAMVIESFLRDAGGEVLDGPSVARDVISVRDIPAPSRSPATQGAVKRWHLSLDTGAGPPANPYRYGGLLFIRRDGTVTGFGEWPDMPRREVVWGGWSCAGGVSQGHYWYRGRVAVSGRWRPGTNHETRHGYLTLSFGIDKPWVQWTIRGAYCDEDHAAETRRVMADRIAWLDQARSYSPVQPDKYLMHGAYEKDSRRTGYTITLSVSDIEPEQMPHVLCGRALVEEACRSVAQSVSDQQDGATRRGNGESR